MWEQKFSKTLGICMIHKEFNLEQLNSFCCSYFQAYKLCFWVQPQEGPVNSLYAIHFCSRLWIEIQHCLWDVLRDSKTVFMWCLKRKLWEIKSKIVWKNKSSYSLGSLLSSRKFIQLKSIVCMITCMMGLNVFKNV